MILNINIHLDLLVDLLLSLLITFYYQKEKGCNRDI